MVWLSYGVHGNESSSTEAALATLYALADPANARTQAWLQDVVVVLDPCLNPDGRERYVDGFHRRLGPARTPTPLGGSTTRRGPAAGRTTTSSTSTATGRGARSRRRALASRSTTAGCRTSTSTSTSRGSMRRTTSPPPPSPSTSASPPGSATSKPTIGRNHAARFDREGWLYFTRQEFDLLYPGYGDTWPTFNGAVGMTYEQAAVGVRPRRPHGRGRHADARRPHRPPCHHRALDGRGGGARPRGDTTSSPATTARRIPGRTAGSSCEGRPGRLPRSLRTSTPGHRVSQAVRPATYGDGATARGGQRFAIAPGDLVVSTDQPKGVLAGVLFDPAPTLSDSLSYDMTAWSLPYVYGLEGWRSRRPSRTAHDASTFAGPPLPGGALRLPRPVEEPP